MKGKESCETRQNGFSSALADQFRLEIPVAQRRLPDAAFSGDSPHKPQK
jgi:hypothetical protein